MTTSFRLLTLLNVALLLSTGNAEKPTFNYKACDSTHYEQCFKANISDSVEAARNYLSQEFVLSHGNRTKYSALLVHGFTDSPYYMKDIAKILFDRGINVIAIRLAGHGTDVNDIKTVTLFDWKADVERGMKLAQQYGDRVIGVGFSTGGALLLNHEAKMKDLAGMALLSPAIEVANKSAATACLPFASLLRPWAEGDGTNENNPTRYNSMATNGVCQVYKLTVQNRAISAKDLDIPIFDSFTRNDQTIDVHSLEFFATQLSPSAAIVQFETPDLKGTEVKVSAKDVRIVVNDSAIQHSGLPLRSNFYVSGNFNSRFDELESALSDFLNNHFNLK